MTSKIILALSSFAFIVSTAQAKPKKFKIEEHTVSLLNASTGEAKWSFTLPSEFNGEPFKLTSPVSDDFTYVTPEIESVKASGKFALLNYIIYADHFNRTGQIRLDLKTGELLSNTYLGETAPTLRIKGETVSLIDPDTGAAKWSFTLPSDFDAEHFKVTSPIGDAFSFVTPNLSSAHSEDGAAVVTYGVMAPHFNMYGHVRLDLETGELLSDAFEGNLYPN